MPTSRAHSIHPPPERPNSHRLLAIAALQGRTAFVLLPPAAAGVCFGGQVPEVRVVMVTFTVIPRVSILDLFARASSGPCGPSGPRLAFIGHISRPLSCICHRLGIRVFVKVFLVDIQVVFASTTQGCLAEACRCVRPAEVPVIPRKSDILGAGGRTVQCAVSYRIPQISGVTCSHQQHIPPPPPCG